ncbi:MAG: sulfotransferase [Panacagrimonas sp.]
MSRTEPACLILAAPFSGAPVLAAMLGRHPDLRALPELNLGMAPTVNELLHLYDYSQSPIADGLLRAIASLQSGRRDDPGIDDARAWLSANRDWSTAQLLQSLVSAAAPRGVVVYDADSVLRPIELLRLVDAVQDAPIIHLVRHPWSQGVVAVDRLADHLYLAPDFKDHALSPPGLDPQLAWLRANLNIERWVRSTRPERVLRLSWERLIGNPEATLGELCIGLGLRFDDSIADAMVQYEDWEFWGYGSQAAPYGLDAEALEPIAEPVLDLAFGAPRLDGSLPWRRDGAGFAPEVSKLATGFGYA